MLDEAENSEEEEDVRQIFQKLEAAKAKGDAKAAAKSKGNKKVSGQAVKKAVDLHEDNTAARGRKYFPQGVQNCKLHKDTARHMRWQVTYPTSPEEQGIKDR